MKALTVEKAQEIRAGKGHYHWICRDWANFTSKAYSSYAAAGAAADAHCKLCLNGMPVPLLRNCYSIFNGTKYR